MNPTVVSIIIKVLLAAGLAFFLYKDARARDFSWLMWTFVPVISIFLPNLATTIFMVIIVLVIYLLSRPKGDLYKCPHCGKKIHNILAFCPFCRKSVKKECLRCHDTVDWDDERCPHCGSMNLTKF